MAADLERRVNQLDNDVQAIYEMLTGIEGTQRRHGNRLRELGEQLTVVSGRLDSIASVQTEHGAKLDEHGAKLDEYGAKLDGHGAKLDGHGAKLDTIIELLRGSR